MFRMSTQIAILIKLVFLCFAIAWIVSPTASADSTCGGNGQKGCGFVKKCDSGMTKYKGVCRNWGRENKKPWPKSRIGFQCKKNLAPLKVRNEWKCKPCGKQAGQPPCETGRIPFGCGNKLVPEGGICTTCGNEGEKACPKAEFGYPCTGKLRPDSGGICRGCGGENERSCRVGKKGTICDAGLGAIEGFCKPCGGEDEPACPALERGRQCEQWTTETNGICKPCGTAATQACKVTDRGKACQEGYAWQINGTCKMTENGSMRVAATKYLNDLGAETIMGLVSTTGDAAQDEAFFDSMENATAETLPRAPLTTGSSQTSSTNGACPSDFQSYTAGVAGGAGLIKTVSGDAGGAFKCGGSFDEAKWYSSGAHGWTLGAEAEVGIVMGWWKAPPGALRGRSRGVVFDIFEVFSFLKSAASKFEELPKSVGKIKGVPVDPVVAIGVWFNEPEDGVDAADIDWKLQGITIMVGGGTGYGVGVEYVKAKTVQVCGYEEDDCALQRWAEVEADLNLFENGDRGAQDGLVIDVTERAKGYIKADIYAPGKEPRMGVRFDRHTWTDKRDYDRKEDGKTVERICFRRNFEFLRYRDNGKDCSWGTKIEFVGDLDDDWTIPGTGFFEFSDDDAPNDKIAVQVHNRSEQEITVDIYEKGKSPRLDLTFTRHTRFDNRDYELVVDGETKERLCYRSGMAELRYRDSNKDCSWGDRLQNVYSLPDWALETQSPNSAQRSLQRQPVTRASEDRSSSSGTGLFNTLWMFEVQGNKFYLKVVDAASGKIVIQNVNSTNRVTYTQTSSGEYVANSGQRLSFESASAGEWISADGSRKYPMSRVN